MTQNVGTKSVFTPFFIYIHTKVKLFKKLRGGGHGPPQSKHNSVSTCSTFLIFFFKSLVRYSDDENVCVTASANFC